MEWSTVEWSGVHVVEWSTCSGEEYSGEEYSAAEYSGVAGADPALTKRGGRHAKVTTHLKRHAPLNPPVSRVQWSRVQGSRVQ